MRRRTSPQSSPSWSVILLGAGVGWAPACKAFHSTSPVLCVRWNKVGRPSLQVDQILGRGAFKTVYKGFDEDEGVEVAWNQVRVSELVSTKEERDRLFAEIRVLKQLKHKNIMTFHDSWLDSKTMTVNFITELFTSGTLRQ